MWAASMLQVSHYLSEQIYRLDNTKADHKVPCNSKWCDPRYPITALKDSVSRSQVLSSNRYMAQIVLQVY